MSKPKPPTAYTKFLRQLKKLVGGKSEVMRSRWDKKQVIGYSLDGGSIEVFIRPFCHIEGGTCTIQSVVVKTPNLQRSRQRTFNRRKDGTINLDSVAVAITKVRELILEEKKQHLSLIHI